MAVGSSVVYVEDPRIQTIILEVIYVFSKSKFKQEAKLEAGVRISQMPI